MFELQSILLFMLASLAINISPGPSILYVSTVAASQGLRASLISVAGMSVGIFFHVLAAATGLAALLASSATVFTIIKYIGAAYLIFLGVKTLANPVSRAESKVAQVPGKLVSFFYRGIFVDLFNPKIGLFFLAFLPQFLDINESNTFIKTMVLGMVFIVVGGLVNSSIAFAIVKSLKKVRSRPNQWLERWIPGCVLVGLGGRLAYQDL